MLNKGEMILFGTESCHQTTIIRTEWKNEQTDATTESFIQRQRFKWDGKRLENDPEVIHQLGNKCGLLEPLTRTSTTSKWPNVRREKKMMKEIAKAHELF